MPSQGRAHTLVDVLMQGAAVFGSRPALIDDEAVVSYDELSARAVGAAAVLVEHGVRRGDVVLVVGPSCASWVVAAFGVLLAGAVVAPLRATPSEHEQARARADLDPVCVVAQSGCWSEVAAGGLPVLSFDELARDAPAVQPPEIGRDDVALVLSTSGTSGATTDVSMTHGQLVRLYTDVSNRLGITHEDRLLGAVPLAHSFGFNGVLLVALVAGACVRLVGVYDRTGLADLVRAEHLSVVAGPPTILYDLEHAGGRLDTCRLAITGSAEVSVARVRRVCDLLGIRDAVVGYGLTEACGTVALGFLPRASDGPDSVAMSLMPDVEVLVTDDDARPLPIGRTGRIHVRGYNVCAEGWLDTGDLGRLDAAGRLVVESRRDDLIVVSGFNVYPREVEEAMITHPGVAAAVVVGLPDERQGQRLVAGVVPESGSMVTEDDLRSHVRAMLAAYKVPRAVVVLDALPVTANGKVSRAALRRRLGGAQ